MNSSEWIIPNPTEMNPEPLLSTNPVTAYVYITVKVIFLVVGVLGNVFLLVTLFMNRKLQKIGRHFLINQAFADLYVAAVSDPLCLIAIFKGYTFYCDVFLCHFIAKVCLIACYCAFMSLCLLTVSRMIYICHNHSYNAIFGRWRKYVLCTVCWFIGILRVIYENQTYMIVITILLICLPLVVILAANLKVFATIHSTKLQLNEFKASSKSKVWSETLKASRTLFLIGIAFSLCWGPYAITCLVDVIQNGGVNSVVKLYITMTAHAHSCINFLLYMTTSHQFRKAFINIFTSSVEQSTSGVSKTNSTLVAKYTVNLQSTDKSSIGLAASYSSIDLKVN